MGLVGRERLVVAGDFRQLGPIAVSQSKAAFDWLHKDAFELAGIKNNLNHPALGMLTNQRRMHSDICDIINRQFYGNKLTTQVDGKKTYASALPPLPGKPAVLVSYLPADGSQSEQTGSGSRLNHGSAQIASVLAATYVKCEQKVKVGLITPYRAQVALVKRLLKDMKLPAEQSDRITVGTVHAFQGAEADIIIFDLVDSRQHPIGRLYRGDTGNRLVNVAISRAQGKLVLIGDPETFLNGAGYQAVDRFRNILSLRFSGAQGNVIRAKDLKIEF
jgi:superfamily I DNA and/or RNA helicase